MIFSMSNIEHKVSNLCMFILWIEESILGFLENKYPKKILKEYDNNKYKLYHIKSSINYNAKKKPYM